jgi:hypothetical protein
MDLPRDLGVLRQPLLDRIEVFRIMPMSIGRDDDLYCQVPGPIEG